MGSRRPRCAILKSQYFSSSLTSLARSSGTHSKSPSESIWMRTYLCRWPSSVEVRSLKVDAPVGIIMAIGCIHGQRGDCLIGFLQVPTICKSSSIHNAIGAYLSCWCSMMSRLPTFSCPFNILCMQFPRKSLVTLHSEGLNAYRSSRARTPLSSILF